MLIDSHCHLDFPDFADDLEAVLSRARAKGVGRFLTICTRVEKFAQVLQLAGRHGDVYCSVGTHPHNAKEELHISVEQLLEKAKHPKVVAIGEAGLDYHYTHSSPEAQKEVFLKHIEAARQSQLPLVIHARSADNDMIKILKQEMKKGGFPAVLHCFSSGLKLAQTGLELGFYISFSGIVTFKNASLLREVARNVPQERLLVETDAPYLAPAPYRGKRNEPAFVAETASFLADVLEIEAGKFAAQTSENFFRLFNKAPQEASPA